MPIFISEFYRAFGQGIARKFRAKLMEDMSRKNVPVLDFAVSEATKKTDIAGGGKYIGNIVKP